MSTEQLENRFRTVVTLEHQQREDPAFLAGTAERTISAELAELAREIQQQEDKERG